MVFSLAHLGAEGNRTLDNTFDVIVVGAGSAGCIVANRLSRDPASSVLVLEAGGWDWNPLISIPVGARKMTQWGLYEWGDMSEPDPQLEGRRNPVLHGKVVGGSSSLNYMAHTRGHPRDYEQWAAAAAGWGFDDVLPFFKEIEAWEGGEDDWRGGHGEVGAIEPTLSDPIFEAGVKMVKSQGYHITPDFNGATPQGVGRMQFSVRNGRRASSAAVFLRPVLRRRNLTVRTQAFVTKILFEGRQAVGVEYIHGGRRHVARSTRRTVLCLGAINTPHLLMLSGIGPADHLRACGIEPFVDLPVGKGLQDHLGFGLTWSRQTPGPFHRLLRFDRIGMAMIQAQLFGSGPASAPPAALVGFLCTDPSLSQPDVEIVFSTVPSAADYWFPGVKRAYTDGYAIRSWLLSQKSRGEILLRSSDPRDRPRIIINALSAVEDRETMRAAFRRMWAMGEAPELAPFRDARVTPDRELKTDAEIDAFVAAQTTPQYHPACTCAMGDAPHTVVSADLSVHGVEGLNVVDASVMPTLISGNPNVVIMMMAAKAASLWT